MFYIIMGYSFSADVIDVFLFLFDIFKKIYKGIYMEVYDA